MAKNPISPQKKIVPAPKGAQLTTENPNSIKNKAIKMRLQKAISGGQVYDGRPKTDTYEKIINAAKVASAFSLGKGKEGKYSAR